MHSRHTRRHTPIYPAPRSTTTPIPGNGHFPKHLVNLNKKLNTPAHIHPKYSIHPHKFPISTSTHHTKKRRRVTLHLLMLKQKSALAAPKRLTLRFTHSSQQMPIYHRNLIKKRREPNLNLARPLKLHNGIILIVNCFHHKSNTFFHSTQKYIHLFY